MRADLVTRTLIEPAAALSYSLKEWDQLIRLARRANVLSRIAAHLEQIDSLTQAPLAAHPHLLAALRLAQRQRIAVRAEAERIAQALGESGIPLILLKGAAYLLADLPCAHGRLFNDIDFIVAKEMLPEVESVLLRHGWITTHHSAYDQQYYRRWMHEIPPLRHLQRHSILDVHYNILPTTARQPPDARLLLEAAQPVVALGEHTILTLAPADMVLHSACHLFHEGELENGLRDLSDLDQLLRHFGADNGFWAQLTTRAEALHLQRPLYYALQLSSTLLHTPVPAAVQNAMQAHAPPGLQRMAMDALYVRALRPAHALASDRWTPLARWLLYVRSHWLRMPPHLLAYHLGRKAAMRWLGLEDADEETSTEKTATGRTA